TGATVLILPDDKDHTQSTSAAQGLWLDTAPASNHPPLAGRVDADVAVVGGGIAGMTVALLLQREGVRVVLLEAGRIGTGVTGCTTAKLSALQATTYTKILSRHGPEVATTYAEASTTGVERLASIVAGED